MNSDQPNIIRRPTLLPLTDGNAHNLTDTFALAWIFSAALSAGLLMLTVNRFTLAITALSLALAGIWWTLSHLKRRR
jgi:hypothetical protein